MQRFGRRRRKREAETIAVYKRGGVWWYKFVWKTELIRQSTKQGNKRRGADGAAKRTALAKGRLGSLRSPRRRHSRTSRRNSPAAIEIACAEKPRTIEFYASKLKPLVVELGDLRLEEIEEAAIDEYVQRRVKTKTRRKKGLTPAPVNRELATLRRLLRLAQEWKILDRVPRIHLLRGEHHREFTLNHQQEKLYLDTATGDLRDVATALLDTGLRVRECLTLD